MMNSSSIYYIELAQNVNTYLGDGEIVYHGLETTQGEYNAVNCDQAKTSNN